MRCSAPRSIMKLTFSKTLWCHFSPVAGTFRRRRKLTDDAPAGFGCGKEKWDGLLFFPNLDTLPFFLVL